MEDQIYKIKRLMLVEEAKHWIGVQEKGHNMGKEVEMFQKAVDGKAAGEPYCCAFVQFCVRKVDDDFDRENGIICPPHSTIAPTESVAVMWDRSPKELRSDDPEGGSISVWRFYYQDLPTPFGHCGIVVNVPIEGQFMYCVEANTGPGPVPVEIDREGDGVYLRRRSLLPSTDTMRLIGFLKPWG